MLREKCRESHNNISWYEDIASFNEQGKQGQTQHHSRLELTQINRGKISGLFATVS